MGRPLEVVLDLTERCNLKCTMCYFSAIDRLRFPPFDRELAPSGMMPLPIFEKIAGELFPRAWRVALACAAEPLLHPQFREVVAIAGRYGVPHLWFPTNLLALTEQTAEAIVDADVDVVAASIDGTTRETYEKIRVGGSFERLLARLELLREVKRRRGARRPKLRIIFTWMKTNREELRSLPEFAERQGAVELDVRFVTPTVGVDLTDELLSGEDRAALDAELAATAREAVERGLRLASYPAYREERAASLLGRARHKLWRWRAGLERVEYLRSLAIERFAGCAYPGRTVVVRPNGAVEPCIFWDQEPIGLIPQQELADILAGEPLRRIRDGLRCGRPTGTCRTCTQRRDSFYRPFHVLLGSRAEVASGEPDGPGDDEVASPAAESAVSRSGS